MNRTKDIIVERTATILDCYRQLEATHFKLLVCVDDGRLLGVVSDADLRRAIISGMQLDDSVTSVVNTSPVVAGPEMDARSVLELMRARTVDPIPVVDGDGTYIGLYTVTDVLGLLTLPNYAVIMAGGLGSRLNPLTKNIPKPLLRIDGKTIIERIIGRLSDNGIENVCVSLNYKPDMFRKVLGDGGGLGVNLTYVEEERPLGTIGSLSLLGPEVREHDFIVINGDVLADIDYRSLIETHESSGNLLTACVTTYRYHVPYGVMDLRDGCVVAVNEKPEHGFHINAGIYCVSPEIIDFIPSDEYFDAIMLMQDFLERRIPIGSFLFDKYWRDIGDFETYFRTRSDYPAPEGS